MVVAPQLLLVQRADVGHVQARGLELRGEFDHDEICEWSDRSPSVIDTGNDTRMKGSRWLVKLQYVKCAYTAIYINRML